MVRSARFSWNDDAPLDLPDRSTGLDDLDDFDGLEIARRRRKPTDGRSKGPAAQPRLTNFESNRKSE